MEKIVLEKNEITLENLNTILNKLFYEVKSTANKYDVDTFFDCLDGCPRKDIIGVQMLSSYLNGTGYEYFKDEATGKGKYFGKNKIDPKIIYVKTNDLIDFINNEESNILNNSSNELDERMITVEDLQKMSKPTPNFVRMNEEEKEKYKDLIKTNFNSYNIKSVETNSGEKIYFVKVSDELAKLLDFEVDIDNSGEYEGQISYAPESKELTISRVLKENGKNRGSSNIGGNINYFNEKGDIARETIIEIFDSCLETSKSEDQNQDSLKKR